MRRVIARIAYGGAALLWIAALVVENDVHLFSRDAHFDRLPQLPRAA